MPDEKAIQEEEEVEDEESTESTDEKPPPNKGYAVGGLQRTPQ